MKQNTDNGKNTIKAEQQLVAALYLLAVICGMNEIHRIALIVVQKWQQAKPKQ